MLSPVDKYRATLILCFCKNFLNSTSLYALMKGRVTMKKSKAITFGLASAATAAGLAYYVKEKLHDDDFKDRLKTVAGDGLSKVLEGVDTLLPKLPWPDIDDYTSENFYAGHEKFNDASVKGAKWQLGYARASLVPSDFESKDYYLGGFLTNPPGIVKSILDDQAVRVVCLDDGSGRGAAVFAVIDCIGLSSTDVRTVRSMLKQFAQENNIVSINISATHCHSAIDTQGIWGVLPDMLKNNVKEIKKGRPQNTISGRDPEFMKNLHSKTSEAVKEAFNSMKKGKLLYKTFDDLKYSRDKRKPEVLVKDITKIHFIPDDGSAETVAALMAAHPTALDSKVGELSADYIYYIEEEVKKAGSNFIFFQGPQLAIAVDRGIVPEGAQGRGFQEYGRTIGKYLLSITAEQEEKVLPILNIRSKEVFVPAGNMILLTVLKAGIVNNIVVKTGKKAKDVRFVTEIGYTEIGKNLRFAMIPGEMAPELLLGGTLTAAESCNGTSWDFPPMKDMLADGTNLVVIGLCNDSIGYILPDNDYGCIFAENHYEEAVSAGPETASTLVGAFEKLVDSCGRLVK